MKPFVMLILILALLGACGAEATPTPDAIATQIAVEKAAHATMTAEVPTSTSTPLSTRTPKATDTATVAATATATKAPTFTSTPTLTPAPTTIPVIVPEYWKTYEHFSGRFTVAHPPVWTVNDESPSSVSFNVSPFALSNIGIFKPECELNFEHDPEQAQRCLAVYVADFGSSLDTFQLVSTDLWDDGVYQGYVVEAREKDYVYDVWSYQVWVFIPPPNESTEMISVLYRRAGTKNITNEEREELELVLRSFRLGFTLHPVITTTPTGTPKPTDTPQPTATPVTVNVGEWLEAKGYRLRIIGAEIREPVTWPPELECREPCIAVVAEVSLKTNASFITNVVSLSLVNNHGQKAYCHGVTAEKYREEHGIADLPKWAPVGQAAGLLVFCEPAEHETPWQKGPLYALVGSASIPADAADGAEGKRVRLGISLD
jgi:hypothetical protein